MDNLDKLNERISQLVADKHQTIIAGLFFRIKKDHSSHNWKICKCSLCYIMKQYIYEKIQYGKIKRIASYGGYILPDDSDFFEQHNFYHYTNISNDLINHKKQILANAIQRKKQQMKDQI